MSGTRPALTATGSTPGLGSLLASRAWPGNWPLRLHRMHHRAREAENRAAPAVLSAHAGTLTRRQAAGRTAVADQHTLLAWTD